MAGTAFRVFIAPLVNKHCIIELFLTLYLRSVYRPGLSQLDLSVCPSSPLTSSEVIMINYKCMKKSYHAGNRSQFKEVVKVSLMLSNGRSTNFLSARIWPSSFSSRVSLSSRRPSKWTFCNLFQFPLHPQGGLVVLCTIYIHSIVFCFSFVPMLMKSD